MPAEHALVSADFKVFVISCAKEAWRNEFAPVAQR